MPPISRDQLDACLAVLAASRAGLLAPADAAEIDRAVIDTQRGIKKRLKAGRAEATRDHDRRLTAAAERYAVEIPDAAPPPAAEPAGSRRDAAPPAAEPAGPSGDVERPALRRARRCYVCKTAYRAVDPEYHLMCAECARFNAARRTARCDLRGRRALVTGGRVKIGFHTALKLLRDGAEVLVTTRFARDAARRFAAVPDVDDWADRLHVHGVDLLDLPATLELIEAVRRRWDGLDILVNNAAQTLYRPAGYHREVRAAEASALTGTAARIAVTAAPAGADGPRPLATLESFFPAGRSDETGQQLDLRPVNSWVLRDADVLPAEWLQVHVVNAFAPFLLTSRLRPLLAAAPRPDRYVVQVSAMEGSYSRAAKTPRHPHTNMAKAALNMLTRTVADDYHRDGIHMNSVDTGWVTDERPHPDKTMWRDAGFRPPLDVIDGAARVYDPIVRGVGGAPVHGQFLKDYRSTAW